MEIAYSQRISHTHTLSIRSIQPLKPKLVKECDCPTARTEKEKARAHNIGYT